MVFESIQEIDPDKEIYYKNIGGSITARILQKIVTTGKHTGTFGGKDIESCAKAIIALHEKIKELEQQVFMLTHNHKA